MSISEAFRWPEVFLRQRSQERELLEAEGVSDEAAAQSYRELSTLQNWLGNTGAVLRLLRTETNGSRGAAGVRILDIGCGQGSLLVAIRERLGLEVIGMDMRPAPSQSPVPIVTGNAVTDPLPQADVAVCMMLAHHLDEDELAALIANVSRSCRRFILLDLVRHPLPLLLFRLFVAPMLCRMNAQDGQTSIRRAYTAAEMRRIVTGALHDSRGQKSVRSLRHRVGPLWIRQVVDIRWE